MKHRINKGLMILLMLFSFFVSSVMASEKEQMKEDSKKEFNAKDFIFDHILDGYEFHVTAIGDHHISIPLPVIVKSQDRGWFVFLSSKFEHGHASYEGFRIPAEGEYKGKVVEVLPDGSEVRPFDMSITRNVFTIILVAIILLSIFLWMAHCYKKEPMKAPGGFRGVMEVVVLFILDGVIKPCIGKNYARYSPYLLTVFFFILLNNLLGLIPIFPGGANVTGNIAVTFVLAVITFLFVNIFATKEYWKDIFLVPASPMWLKVPIPMMPVLEIVGVFTKPIALMIRLFANIMAGHIIAMVFMSLIFIFAYTQGTGVATGVGIFSCLFSLFMQVLEVLVAFLQAYVFTLLSSVFIGLSQIEEHHA